MHQKESESNELRGPEKASKRDPKLPDFFQLEAIELKAQEELKRRLQVAGTVPSDDVIHATETLYSSARSLLALIYKQYRSNSMTDIDTIEAEKRFCKFTEWIVEELCRLAKQGHYDPLRAAWHGGQVLAETIHDVALDGPSEQLQRIARGAIFMPSLRADTKSFEYNFKEVAKKIQLSKGHTLRVDPQAEYQMDRSTTRFVVKMIECFTLLRETLAEQKEKFSQFKNDPQATLESATTRAMFKLRKPTLDGWLYWHFPPDRASQLLLCQGIKPLSKYTTDEWLKQFLMPLIGSYKNLQELIGTVFYQELEAAAILSKSSKPYAVKDELMKRCRQVLEGRTFFREDVAPPEGISPGT